MRQAQLPGCLSWFGAVDQLSTDAAATIMDRCLTDFLRTQAAQTCWLQPSVPSAADRLTCHNPATGPAKGSLHHGPGFAASSTLTLSTPHLLRGYLGSRASLSVFGRWKVVEYRGLRSFLKLLRVTALAAFAAFDLLFPPAGKTAGMLMTFCDVARPAWSPDHASLLCWLCQQLHGAVLGARTDTNDFERV